MKEVLTCGNFSILNTKQKNCNGFDIKSSYYLIL